VKESDPADPIAAHGHQPEYGWRAVLGILCDTAPTLLPIADDNPSPTLAERTRSPEAVAVAGRLFSGDFSEPTRRSVSRATLVEFADAGHFPFSEEPAAFAQAVENFLMELEGRPIGLIERV